MSTSNDKLDEILKRLRTLEDEKAVLETLHLDCLASDCGSEEEWLELFLPNAVLDNLGPADMLRPLETRGGEAHARGIRFSGKERLAGFIGGRKRASGWQSQHATV